MNLNRVIIMGRLCADPDFRQTQSGVPCCRIRLAVNRPTKQGEEQKADFINVSCWRATAEFVARFFSKGKMAIVEGCLRNNDYTDQNGVKHYSMDVLAQQVMFGEPKGTTSDAGQTYNPQYGTPQPQNVPQYGAVPAPNNNPYAPQNAPQTAAPRGYGQIQNAMQAPPQYTGQAAAARPAEALNIGDLGEFEEILSDGEVPF